MGQAKRRKQQLGDLYGTPEGSNGFGASTDQREPPLKLRHMTAAEINECPPVDLGGSGNYAYLMGSLDGVEFPVVVRPVIDAAGQFNSYACALWPKGRPGAPLQGKRKSSDQKAVNQYLLATADVVISS